jgi:hypothetical protein
VGLADFGIMPPVK